MDLSGQLRTCHATYRAGNLAAAEQQYQAIARKFPDVSDVHHLGALIAQAMNQLPHALARIQKAVVAAPTHYEYLNTLGNIHLAAQNIPMAINAYKSSVQLKQDYKPALANLGMCLIDNDHPVDGLAVYEAALELDPNDMRFKIGKIIALKELRRDAEALAALDSIENSETFGYLRGQILMNLERYDDAIKANERELSNPQAANGALRNMMQCYFMQGEWEEGRDVLQEALASKGQQPAFHATAATLFGRAGDSEKAYETVEVARTLFGDQPELLAVRARLDMEEQDFENAWKHAQAALTARLGDLSIMEEYADSALAAGLPINAMIAAEEALKVQPCNQYWIAIKYTAGRAMGQDYRYYTNVDNYVRAYDLIAPNGYKDMSSFNEALKAELTSLHGFKAHPLDQSLRMGTQTMGDLRFSGSPVIEAFFTALDAPIRDYMAKLGTDPRQPLENRNTGSYRFTGAWSVKLTAGGHHVNHVHPRGWISSSYYVDVPNEVSDKKSKKGWINFGAPPMPVKDKAGKLLTPELYIKPEPGKLVLFPSYLWHGTVPITGNDPRMTLPFDVVPA